MTAFRPSPCLCKSTKPKVIKSDGKAIPFPRISLTTKHTGRKNFLKGSGQRPDWRKSAGHFDEHGLYKIEERKVRTFVVPKGPFDHALRPYVAKTTAFTEEVKNQWPSRWKRIVADENATTGHRAEDMPFDGRVDGHYLLQLGQHFATLESFTPEQRAEIEGQQQKTLERAYIRPRETPEDPQRKEEEIGSLDPHIETPSEVMQAERRLLADRSKVAVDREIDAYLKREGLPERNAGLEVSDEVQWSDEVALPLRTDAAVGAWDPTQGKSRRRGFPRPRVPLRRVRFGSPAPALRTPKLRELPETMVEVNQGGSV